MSSSSYDRLKIVRSLHPQPLSSYKQRVLDYGGDHIHSLTDVGYEKNKNEDFVIQFDHGVIMCDGVGGMKNGELASQVVAKKAYELLTEEFLTRLTVQYRKLQPIDEVLNEFLDRLNQETFQILRDQMILSNGYGRVKDIGYTTLSMAIEIEDNMYVCFSIGDSLIYKKTQLGINRVIGSHCTIDSVINKSIKKAKLTAAIDGLGVQERRSLVKESYTDALNAKIQNPTMISYSVPMPPGYATDFNYNLIKLEYGESLLVLTDGISDCVIVENILPQDASPERIMQFALDVQYGKAIPEEIYGNFKTDNLTISEIQHKESYAQLVLGLKESFAFRQKALLTPSSNSYRDAIPEAYIPSDTLEYRNIYCDRMDEKLRGKRSDEHLHNKTKIITDLFDEKLELFSFINSASLRTNWQNYPDQIKKFVDECNIILQETVAAAIELNDLKIICNLLYVFRAYILTREYSVLVNHNYIGVDAYFEQAINKLKHHLLNNFNINKLMVEDLQTLLALKTTFGVEIKALEPFKAYLRKLRRSLKEYYYNYEIVELTLDPMEIKETSKKHNDFGEMYKDLFEGVLIFNHFPPHQQKELENDMQEAINQIATIDLISIINTESDFKFYSPLIENLASRIRVLDFKERLTIVERITNPKLKILLFKEAIYASQRKNKLSIIEIVKKYYGKYRLPKMTTKERLNFVFKYYSGKEFDKIFTEERIHDLVYFDMDKVKSLTVES